MKAIAYGFIYNTYGEGTVQIHLQYLWWWHCSTSSTIPIVRALFNFIYNTYGEGTVQIHLQYLWWGHCSNSSTIPMVRALFNFIYNTYGEGTVQFHLQYLWWGHCSNSSTIPMKGFGTIEPMLCYFAVNTNNKRMEGVARGVDNGAAGEAAAAPIIWQVVVIQKWRTFRRPPNNFFAFMNAIWVSFSETTH